MLIIKCLVCSGIHGSLTKKTIKHLNHHLLFVYYSYVCLLIGRYEDVTDPPEWVSSPVIATEADFAAHRQTLSGSTLAATSCDGVQFDPMQLYVIHYWHVKARKSIPRKPDGLPVCVHCHRNIASHHCTTCKMEYCLACHRGTHGNPFGFRQFAKATKEQYSDPGTICCTSLHINMQHLRSLLFLLDPCGDIRVSIGVVSLQNACNTISHVHHIQKPSLFILMNTVQCCIALQFCLQRSCSSCRSTSTLSPSQSPSAVRCARAPRSALVSTATRVMWTCAAPAAEGTKNYVYNCCFKLYCLSYNVLTAM